MSAVRHARRALTTTILVAAAACSRTKPAPPAADASSAATASASASPETPAPVLVNLPPLPPATGKGTFSIPGRAESAIEVVVPENHPPKPPLVIAFHGTGEEPENAIASFDLVEKAQSLGFVAIVPRAGHRDTPHPPDVDHPENWGGSSWNMWTAKPDANEDLLYVRALIEAAKKSWNADTARVYTVGFSNGAYFAYFVAASMPDRIAGFAEMSGGWPTEACPRRTDQDGTSLYLLKTAGPAGKEMSCGAVFADPRFPKKCRVTAANKLVAPTPKGRVPFGYLAHYTADDSVSVAWSCLLAEGLGARAKTMIRSREPDGTTGHYPMPDFMTGAFKFWAGRTNAD